MLVVQTSLVLYRLTVTVNDGHDHFTTETSSRYSNHKVQARESIQSVERTNIVLCHIVKSSITYSHIGCHEGCLGCLGYLILYFYLGPTLSI